MATRPLTTDVRFTIFAVLFAFGTILHELEFFREVVPVGPLREYMERWGRAVPTIGWSSDVGIALHVADIAISLYLLVGRRRREAVCLLAVVFLLTQFVSPQRIASHNSVMFGALVVVLVLSLGEWWDRWRGRRPMADWYGWTLTGLALVCSLTYFFAFFYKLNAKWHSLGGPGPVFLIEPLAPLLDPFFSPTVSRPFLGWLTIYATLVIELALPFAFAHPRTRRLACFAGAAFHVPMAFRGVVDFPVLMLALYPAYLTADEVRAALRVMARPGIARVVGSLVVIAWGIWALSRAPQPVRQAAALRRIHPLVGVASEVTGWLTVVLVVVVTFGLGAWLLQRWRLRAAEPGAGATEPSAIGEVSGRRAAPAVLMALVVAACAANQVAPFLGLPRAGALIMYSGLNSNFSNHVLRDHLWLTDAFGFARVSRFEPVGIEGRRVRDAITVVGDGTAPYAIHLNVLRYHVDRVCRSAPGGKLRLELRQREVVREVEDACVERGMRWYLPIPLGHVCHPNCRGLVFRSARSDTETESD